MNLRRHVTILGAAAFGAASPLGSNFVHAETDPSSAAGEIVYKTIDKPSARLNTAGITYTCAPDHPYLGDIVNSCG
ncbi:hypothetical protein LQL77_32380 [Rhodococcus cerastii]|nr:hypothetical protein [Rhodococcus cerastii]